MKINFKSTKLHLAIAISTILGSTQAAQANNISFTELPVAIDISGYPLITPVKRVAVSNNGIVAFKGVNNFYKWTQQSGLQVLGDASVRNGSLKITSISDDGNVIMFNTAFPDDAMIYTGEEEFYYDKANSFEFGIASLSPDGTKVGGHYQKDLSQQGSYSYVAVMNLQDGTYYSSAVDENGHNEVNQYVSAINNSGNKEIWETIPSLNGYASYLVTTTTSGPVTRNEITPLQRNFESITNPVMSTNGEKLVGEYSNHNTNCGSLCGGALWEDDNFTYLGDFKPRALNADGSTVVGARGSYYQGESTQAVIWDSYNGERDLKDALLDNGIDITDWSETALTDISDDGNTLVGIGINPDGIAKPFVVSILPICTPGL